MENYQKLESSLEEQVWLVWPGRGQEQVPAACFSEYKPAKRLANCLESIDPPTAVYPSETNLEIDKYLPEMHKLNIPFDVNMYADGTFFEAFPAQTLGEPEIAYAMKVDPETKKMVNDHAIGISGIFWSYDVEESIEQADQFRLEMIEQGKLQPLSLDAIFSILNT